MEPTTSDNGARRGGHPRDDRLPDDAARRRHRRRGRPRRRGRVRHERGQRSLRRLPCRSWRHDEDPQEPDHGVHRPVGLRKDDRAAMPQPDERLHPDGQGGGIHQLPRRRSVRPRRELRPRSVAVSAWCSRSRTRSRSRSTTTLRTVLASPACASEPNSTTSSSSRCAALHCGTRSRIASSRPASACRAVSNSDSASPVRSPSAPT